MEKLEVTDCDLKFRRRHEARRAPGDLVEAQESRVIAGFLGSHNTHIDYEYYAAPGGGSHGPPTGSAAPVKPWLGAPYGDPTARWDGVRAVMGGPGGPFLL